MTRVCERTGLERYTIGIGEIKIVFHVLGTLFANPRSLKSILHILCLLMKYLFNLLQS